MFDRRRVIAALAALFLPALAAPRALAAPGALKPAPMPAPAAGTGLRLVDGWIVTEADLAMVDRLAR